MHQAKSIATITFHRSDNFGSVLQCYALGEKLCQLGYNQFVIDYRKKEVADAYQIIKKPTTRYLFLTDIYHLLHYPSLKKRQQRFEDFRKQHLRLTPAYFSKEALERNPPPADVYITGSDQVWNTDIGDFDESYLLAFVDAGRRIAYAASGVAKLTQEKHLYLKEHITRFDAVSLRENKSAVALGQKQVVIDPVLLLTKQDWESLCIDMHQKQEYMLCYYAGGVSAAFEKFTKEKAAELGLQRIVLSPEWRNLFRKGKYAYNTGPIEFISLIRDATLICTNSFHGTAFSILFNKPFLVGQHYPFTDDRIATLLTVTGLSAHEIDPANPTLPENILEVDYSKVNAVLDEERKIAVNWLQTAIEGEPRCSH